MIHGAAPPSGIIFPPTSNLTLRLTHRKLSKSACVCDQRRTGGLCVYAHKALRGTHCTLRATTLDTDTNGALSDPFREVFFSHLEPRSLFTSVTTHVHAYEHFSRQFIQLQLGLGHSAASTNFKMKCCCSSVKGESTLEPERQTLGPIRYLIRDKIVSMTFTNNSLNNEIMVILAKQKVRHALSLTMPLSLAHKQIHLQFC